MTIQHAPGGGIHYSDDDDRVLKKAMNPDAPEVEDLTDEDWQVLEEAAKKTAPKPAG